MELAQEQYHGILTECLLDGLDENLLLERSQQIFWDTDKESRFSLSALLLGPGSVPTVYRHIRSRLAGTSVVGPDFLAAFAGPGPRSPQC
jgi:hypothetical protein